MTQILVKHLIAIHVTSRFHFLLSVSKTLSYWSRLFPLDSWPVVWSNPHTDRRDEPRLRRKLLGGGGGRNMAQALSEEEFQRMQVPLAGEKTTGKGDGERGRERSCHRL